MPRDKEAADTIDAWKNLCDALQDVAGEEQTPLGCGIIAAVALGISKDSRGFARDFGISHSLVLREVVVLSEEDDLLVITSVDARTQRSFIELTPRGKALVDHLSVR